ncbi:hypothetical protein B0H65DRAFT_479896 [Neurospora tetraspora]|uniref:Uncharacterized protein n=1 Tax=Neurospora tetraspora TaxID=94610 RepID=A0AAE0J0P8_9PEZI|nr:hypothetical protein B0H65DRAFT_479896 [Neurospora tetraspora]
MKLTKALNDNPIQGSLAVWTCSTPCCQHKEREIQKSRRRRDTDEPKGWRLFFLSSHWKKPCEIVQSIKTSRCIVCQMRDRMLENEARRKATLAAKSYGWTVLEQKQRKQRRKNTDNNNNNNNSNNNRGRSAKCSSSYGLYGEVLQMLPIEKFNRYVKGRPTSMIAHESKRDIHRISPTARRRPPLPKLSLVIPGGGGRVAR